MNRRITSAFSKKYTINLIIITGMIMVVLTASVYFRTSFAESNNPIKEPVNYELNDSHLHLTNYIQKGPDIRSMLKIMGEKTGRAALFGIPLQQQWTYHISGDRAPTYYLESDAPLYYYSFTDAHIAMAYLSLTKEEQNRFDPMITGFNPSDMYAADHIRRVLTMFPGVFSGIGEFTIHKEFVSSQVAGGSPSLTDPALDSILSFAEEVGLAVILHNDIDIPFAKDGGTPAYLSQMKALLRRHPSVPIIWAHMGLGRVIHPVRPPASSERGSRTSNQIQIISSILADPSFSHVYFDISWNEVAKYILRNDSTIKVVSELFNRFPDRFLFGTDAVAPTDQEMHLNVYYHYEPLWEHLDPGAREKIKKTNYENIFDRARRKVRAWEKRNGLSVKK